MTSRSWIVFKIVYFKHPIKTSSWERFLFWHQPELVLTEKCIKNGTRCWKTSWKGTYFLSWSQLVASSPEVEATRVTGPYRAQFGAHSLCSICSSCSCRKIAGRATGFFYLAAGTICKLYLFIGVSHLLPYRAHRPDTPISTHGGELWVSPSVRCSGGKLFHSVHLGTVPGPHPPFTVHPIRREDKFFFQMKNATTKRILLHWSIESFYLGVALRRLPLSVFSCIAISIIRLKSAAWNHSRSVSVAAIPIILFFHGRFTSTPHNPTHTDTIAN